MFQIVQYGDGQCIEYPILVEDDIDAVQKITDYTKATHIKNISVDPIGNGVELRIQFDVISEHYVPIHITRILSLRGI